MPSTYTFRDHNASNAVAKALLLVAKFSRKQAIVKFSDSSVSVIWGGSPKSYYVHADATDLDMFDERKSMNSCTIIQVDPSVLGRTLRGGTQGRMITLTIIRPNRVQVIVAHNDNTARTITHTLPCDIKTREDYDLMCIEKIEHQLCRYNTRSYIETAGRFKHILDSFVRLGTPRIYLHSRPDQGEDEMEDENTNCIVINAKNEGSIVDVYLTDLVDGREELVSSNDYDANDSFMNHLSRHSAGVQVDPKKLALFLNLVPRKSRVCLDIEHNKCLKVTLVDEISNGKKMYMCLLLLHSLGH